MDISLVARFYGSWCMGLTLEKGQNVRRHRYVANEAMTTTQYRRPAIGSFTMG